MAALITLNAVAGAGLIYSLVLLLGRGIHADRLHRNASSGAPPAAASGRIQPVRRLMATPVSEARRPAGGLASDT